MIWTNMIVYFAGLTLLIAVFEVFYWILTSRFGVVVKVPKANLCGVYWVLIMIGYFLALREIPDIKLGIVGVVVYALHATLCDKFSRLQRGKKGTNIAWQDDETGGGDSGKGNQSLQRGGVK